MTDAFDSGIQWPLLIVEDDPDQQGTLETLFELEGFRPVACATVEEAAALVAKQEFLVAVVDLRLQGASGLELLEALSRAPSSPAVIIHTGYATFESVKTSLNVGAFAFVEKLADPRELVRQVRRAVEHRITLKLGESAAERAALLDSAKDGILVIEVGSRCITEANPAALEMLGYPRNQLVGMRYDELFGSERPQPVDLHDAAFGADSGKAAEFTLLRADGRTLVTEVSISPISGPDRELLIAIFRDISQRKAFEDALRQSEARLSGLLNHSPAPIALVGCDGRFQLVSERLAEILGREPDGFDGRSLGEVFPAAYADVADRHHAEVLETGRAVTREEVLEIDGKVYEFLASRFPIRDENGAVVAVGSISTDMSEQQEVERALRDTQRRLHTFFDHSPSTMTLKDRDGRYLWVNRAYERYFGVSAQMLQGRSASEAQPGRVAEVDSHDRELLETGQPVEREYELDVGGERRTLLILKFPVVDEGGEVSEIASIGIDITDHKLTQEALERSEERFQGLFDNSPDVYLTVGPDGAIHSVNQFGADYLGFTKADLVGRLVWQLVHEDDRERVKHQIEEAFEGRQASEETEFRVVTRDGRERWVHERTRLEHGEHDGDAELRIVCRDITEAHDLSQELSYQATHDSLTGLVNRRELESRLERVLETARRAGSEHALCYLDLDQFKVINDTCGHVAGDELLRQLGELLPARVRRRDTLSRLGGDEFAVLMEHCSLMQARRVANSLRKAIEEFRFTWEGKAFTIGASIGLAPITPSSNSVADVLSAADTACYVAKDQGRNRIHVYHDDDVELIRRHGEMEWVSRLNWAFEASRFRLYCQPIRRLSKTDEPPSLHVEILLRMLGEDDQIVPPGAFLPAAERYNMSGRLDRWVVAETLEWLSRNPLYIPRLAMCSINLSGASLADDDFLKFVIDKLDHSSLPPEIICFEITETAAIANLTSATRFIAALKGWGCRFALDDFGSGLSSFAYLKHLAVDFLKIDGVFVKDVASDPIDYAMVKSINEVGRVMGKKTIAEFAEHDEIIETLREIGVDYAQGYAISRPVPISEIGTLEGGRSEYPTAV